MGIKKEIMQNIITMVSFEMNDKKLAGEWKEMSDHINESLKKVDGFLSRESAVGKDGKIYCFVKFETAEKQEAFNKIMESDDFKENLVAFAKIANMETMKSEMLNVI